MGRQAYLARLAFVRVPSPDLQPNHKNPQPPFCWSCKGDSTCMIVSAHASPRAYQVLTWSASRAAQPTSLQSSSSRSSSRTSSNPTSQQTHHRKNRVPVQPQVQALHHCLRKQGLSIRTSLQSSSTMNVAARSTPSPVRLHASSALPRTMFWLPSACVFATVHPRRSAARQGRTMLSS